MQDFHFGKYLGHLKVTFDDDGKVKSWSGNPVLLNASYAKDSTVLAMVQKMDDPILSARNVSNLELSVMHDSSRFLQ